jgi:L-lactate dehydrogenase complex protein LldF
MKAAAAAFSGGGWLSMAQRLGRWAQWPFAEAGSIASLPGPAAGWTATRDLPAIPKESFRQWWARRGEDRS